MLKLMEEGYGTNKSIPQLILAGASVDDIFVIVLFTSFTSIATTGSNFSISSIIEIPISIIIGIILGILTGIVLVYLFKKIHIRDSIKILIILSVSFLFITVEDLLKGFIPISGLLAVMSLGATILKIYSKLWVGAEVFLFVLVGASVDIKYAMNSGIITIILILGALVFRIFGVLLSLIKTEMNFKERLFSAIGYMPKATVQAAIGALPLSMGLASGEIILTVAVLSIIITAPLGATLIDNTYKKLLSISKNK